VTVSTFTPTTAGPDQPAAAVELSSVAPSPLQPAAAVSPLPLTGSHAGPLVLMAAAALAAGALVWLSTMKHRRAQRAAARG
jgi:LPXTG-motif cell wall-anchored protein